MSSEPLVLRELDIPPPVLAAKEHAVEFIRFWIADGVDHVILNTGVFDPKDEAHNWGMIMADIARHAVRGMQQNDPTLGTPEQMMAEIQRSFFKRLEFNDANLTGQITGNNQ